MSTSPRAEDAEVHAAEPHEETAGHVGEEFTETITAIRDTVRKPTGLDYLAHYSSGVFDFSIDLLGDPPISTDTPPSRTRRDELRRLGRTLSLTMTEQDRILLPARTGGLIRMVLHTTRSAGFCAQVVPKEYVIGSVLDCGVPGERDDLVSHMAHIQPADIAVAELATRLRRRISLASANPGGWETADVLTQVDNDSSGAPFVTVLTEPDQPTGLLREACERAVRPADLHFVAYCAQGEVRFTADHFGDRSLAPFFTQIAIPARRRFYLDFSRGLQAFATKFARSSRGVLSGPLVRLVLDVEQGAIYYYRLSAGDYLVGVTLDQTMVSSADNRLSQLVLGARELLAG
jgi:hypothetical protein